MHSKFDIKKIELKIGYLIKTSVMESTASNEMSNVTIDINQLKSTALHDIFDDKLIVDIIQMNDDKHIEKLEKTFSSIEIYQRLFEDKSTIDSIIPYSFKNKNQYNFFKNLFERFTFNQFNLNIEMNILDYVIRLDKGQFLLKYIPYKKIISKLNPESKMELYFSAGVSGTLPTFLVIDSQMTEKGITDNYQKSILSAACRNADDRILKYIINKFNNYHLTTWNTEKFVINLINNLFSNHIPTKYILRRMKLVNSKIDLSPYLNNILTSMNDINMFSTICKYYMTPNFEMSKNNIYNLIDNLHEISTEERKSKINEIILHLNNKNKNQFMLTVFFRFGTFYDINVLDFINEDLIDSSIINDILSLVVNTKIDEIYNKINIKELSIIFKNYIPNLKHIILNYKKYIRHLIFMIPFINYFDFNYFSSNNSSYRNIIKLNLVKFQIKTWLRRNCKIIELSNKLKFARETNKFNKITNNLQLQKFTKLPPRHILPFEINSINASEDGCYLIREKADGHLVDFLSNDVVPEIQQFNKNIIKAEFIEELDLYLLFDIKLDNMTIIDRYKYIRSLHPSTSKDSEPTIINNFNELKEAIKEERNIFNRFLKLPYKNYRVYPKAAWLVKENLFGSDIINNIIEEKDMSYICQDGPFKNDGLIISPLNGDRELKVKPKSYHTIDLLFNGKNWVDREKNNHNSIVTTKDGFPPNTIWRCYPTNQIQEIGNQINYMFEPREYRFDKTKPNKNTVVNTIYNLHKINWTNSLENNNNFYYQKQSFEKSDNWKDLIAKQNQNLENILECVEPIIKSKWLDLGCGSGKLLKFIKKYHFNEYVGLDFDINQLLKGIHRIDTNQNLLNNSRLIPVDLKNDWYNHESQWDNLKEWEKFDYIISNFSLSHFYNETFWSKLDRVSKSNSTFIFNLVNDNSLDRWESDNNYLYSKDGIVTYYFDAIHNEEMTEKFINSEELDKIIEKTKWNISMKITPDGKELDSKYTWYVLKCN